MPQVPAAPRRLRDAAPPQVPQRPADDMRGADGVATMAVENLPGAEIAVAIRDSYRIGQGIGPAIREGRYADAVRAFVESTGAAVGMLPAVPSLAGVIRAYHGTPHEFDKFSMDKIGTGEGAQAYGHGLYFAESKGVAKSYQESLSGTAYRLDGRPRDAAERQVVDYLPEAKADAGWLDEIDADSLLRDRISGPDDSDAAEVYDAFRRMTDEGRLRFEAQTGSLYTVDLDVDPEDLLDWDKPLSEQPLNVRERLASLMPQRARPGGRAPHQASPDSLPRMTGRQFYNQLGPQSEATRRLREAGVPGIRYLDAGSRSDGDGTRNVVMFDDALIKILERNGRPASERAAEDMARLADPMSWSR